MEWNKKLLTTGLVFSALMSFSGKAQTQPTEDKQSFIPARVKVTFDQGESISIAEDLLKEENFDAFKAYRIAVLSEYYKNEKPNWENLDAAYNSYLEAITENEPHEKKRLAPYGRTMAQVIWNRESREKNFWQTTTENVTLSRIGFVLFGGCSLLCMIAALNSYIKSRKDTMLKRHYKHAGRDYIALGMLCAFFAAMISFDTQKDIERRELQKGFVKMQRDQFDEKLISAAQKTNIVLHVSTDKSFFFCRGENIPSRTFRLLPEKVRE